MRVVFMGTPAFAASVLDGLFASSHQVVGVFTRPDAINARGKAPLPSLVKQAALAYGIPVFERKSLRSDEAFGELEALQADVICVAAYGALLPKAMLDYPRHGCINVHASLLPRWRGAAPIQRAMLAGDVQTGISIMRIEEGLDTGGVACKRSLAIEQKSFECLSNELAQVGAQALVEVLDALDAGQSLVWQKQDESLVTYAEKLRKDELFVSPAQSCEEFVRRVRAADSSHSCKCTVANRRLTLFSAAIVDAPELRNDTTDETIKPGEVRFVAKRLFLGCADGACEVFKLKPDGKKTMTASAFAVGIQGIGRKACEWTGIDG